MYVMNTNVSCPRVSSWHLTHHCSFGVPSSSSNGTSTTSHMKYYIQIWTALFPARTCSTHCSSPIFYCMMSTSSLWRFRYFDFERMLGYFGVSIIHWFLTGINMIFKVCMWSFCTHIIHTWDTLVYSLIQGLYSCCACSLSDSDFVSIHGDPATGSLCPGQCKKLALYCLRMSTSVRLFMLLVAAEVTQAGSVGAIQITIHT